jgi:hypothetical protein
MKTYTLFSVLLCASLPLFAGNDQNVDQCASSVSQYVTDFEKPSVVVSIDKAYLFSLYECNARSENKDVFVYIICFHDFYDYVVFDRRVEAESVLCYFVDRWVYLVEGIRSGFVHFNEQIDCNTIEYDLLVDKINKSSSITYGSKYANINYNDGARFRYESWVRIVKQYLVVIRNRNMNPAKNEKASEPTGQP